MSFRQRPPVKIEDVLKRTDEQIKNYVSFVFTSHPGKVATLKNNLNGYIAVLDVNLHFAEEQVMDGSFGSASTKEAAAEKLRGWANGTMDNETRQLIANFNKGMKGLEHEMARVVTSLTPREYQEDDSGVYFTTMKDMGKKYVAAETAKQKANLALNHLSTLEVTAAATATASAKPESPRAGV